MGEATVRLTRGLHCRVDRGPNWLFIKLDPAHAVTHSPAEARRWVDKMWDICTRHFTYRLVVELDDLEDMSDDLVMHLKGLSDRLAEHGGALRVCGARSKCERKLAGNHFGFALRNHQNRAAAVLGAK